MNYAQVRNGAITAVGLPASGRLADGRTVSGYDALDPATLAEQGWMQVVDDVPAYDPATALVRLDRHEITGDHVTARYVLDIPGSNAKAITAKATAALAKNATYLALAAPTNAQVAAQVALLTREVNALIKLALGLFEDTTGT